LVVIVIGGFVENKNKIKSLIIYKEIAFITIHKYNKTALSIYNNNIIKKK